MMTKKQIAMAIRLIMAIVFLVWTIAVICLNINCEKQTIITYQIGEVVSYGRNYCEDESDMIDGYKVQVLSGKIYKYDDYLKVMNISDDTKKWHPEYICDLEIRFFNDYSEEDNGIDLISTYLASADNRLAININLLTEMYPQLGESPIGFRIRPGTSMDMHIPFQMEYVPALNVPNEAYYLLHSTFFLNITQYPIKQVVLIDFAD